MLRSPPSRPPRSPTPGIRPDDWRRTRAVAEPSPNQRRHRGSAACRALRQEGPQRRGVEPDLRQLPRVSRSAALALPRGRHRRVRERIGINSTRRSTTATSNLHSRCTTGTGNGPWNASGTKRVSLSRGWSCSTSRWTSRSKSTGPTPRGRSPGKSLENLWRLNLKGSVLSAQARGRIDGGDRPEALAKRGLQSRPIDPPNA